MAKVSHHGQDVWFFCQGCDTNHRITLGRWTWNGDAEKPTFTPSLITDPDGPHRCHLHVRDGWIEYLADCHHGLKGTKVPMEDLD
jgi:hypothetical protein